MKTCEVEVFSDSVNGWIIRTPGRHFPAMVIHGDSFSVLFNSAQRILDLARKSGSTELVEEATALRDELWTRLYKYEEVLEREKLPIPYRRSWPK